jgi:hypothetical protein
LSAKFNNDKETLIDLPQSSINIISSCRPQDALSYHPRGSNVIPIPKAGQQFARISNNDSEISSRPADGKSAKGYGAWAELQWQYQTFEDVERRFHGKKDCSIAILTSTVSGMIAFDID